MEEWTSLLEKFGLPVVMLLGMSWGAVHLFKWLANDLMKQISINQERTEGITIKLIDAINQLKMEVKELKVEIASFGSQQKNTNELMTKLSGNGLRK